MPSLAEDPLTLIFLQESLWPSQEMQPGQGPPSTPIPMALPRYTSLEEVERT